MLTYIHIRALAVVEELELELGGAMSALTGETGAGKSILVDALGLVLGDRADSDVIRHGADRAEVSASFDLTDLPAARAWLQAQELDADGECQLRRVVTREGRSRGYINARPVPIQSLRELGQHLVDIHGQHEHQSLLRRDVQRQLLDDVGGHGEALEQTTAAYADWKRLHGELETLRSAERDRSDRLDLLRFQVRELEALALDADEWEALESEHTRLAHAGQLLETCQRALDGLYEADEGAAHAMLARAAGDLEPLAEIDPRLHGAWELLNSALIQVREGVDELRGYLDRVDLDPQRLAWVEQRLGDIHQLARKHRCDPPELPALQARLSEELDTLEHADQRLEELEQALEAAAAAYRRAAEALSARRRATAGELNGRVEAAMEELGMPGGQFEAAVEPRPQERFGASGSDQVEFRVSANPGQPLMPLTKVASGGELSRISLAIQVITARSSRVPCLVFDEVDSGIGGGVAEVVGRKLRTLGESRQVLCVTHLPQVAAQAHHQLQVSKLAGDTATHTRIRVLEGEERVDELARMLGGIEITEPTRAHAREMMENAQREPTGGSRQPRRRGKGGRRKADA